MVVTVSISSASSAGAARRYAARTMRRIVVGIAERHRLTASSARLTGDSPTICLAIASISRIASSSRRTTCDVIRHMRAAGLTCADARHLTGLVAGRTPAA